MDQRRKYAYRHIIDDAMLDLRSPTAALSLPIQWWNPLFWRRLLVRHRYAVVVADWLHNLAAFSAWDFADFDEQRFWREYEALASRYPAEVGLRDYRAKFTMYLSSLDTGFVSKT